MLSKQTCTVDLHRGQIICKQDDMIVTVYLLCHGQCWGSLLKKVTYYTLHITLKNSNALHYMITP